MGQAFILLEIGILAVSFGVVMVRRGYIGAHKRPYSSSNLRLHFGVVLILVGLALTTAGIFTF